VTAPTAPSLPHGAVGQSSKIEQSGTLGLSVGRGDLGRTMTRLTTLADANGGFVASSQTQSGAGTDGAPDGSITLQVPVDSFSAVLKQAQALGTTSDLTTKATDVTGQFVDLQARITALEASRQQYLTIMTKASTVGDVLAVQEELDTIQSQIEQLLGQLQVLTGETSYSTLTVAVEEGTPPAPPRAQPESGLLRAWDDSLGGFVAGVEGVIRLSGPTLFAVLCTTCNPAPAQRLIAAASGIPGIVTTPTPPEGLASSLIAMGPPARTMMGSNAAEVRTELDTTAAALAARVPVAIGSSPVGVTANAV
jgi:hypothetical protein